MSKTTLETFLPDRRYTWSVPAPAAAATTANPAAAAPPRPGEEEMLWEDFLPIMMKALQPFPGAAVSISQAIERHFGREALYPIHAGGNETPA